MQFIKMDSNAAINLKPTPNGRHSNNFYISLPTIPTPSSFRRKACAPICRPLALHVTARRVGPRPLHAPYPSAATAVRERLADQRKRPNDASVCVCVCLDPGSNRQVSIWMLVVLDVMVHVNKQNLNIHNNAHIRHQTTWRSTGAATRT